MPLVTIVAHIVIEKQTAYIICCIMPVNTEKMPVESFTEPIADFRLDQPVFQPILIEFPRIVIPGNVHGHFFPHAKFNTQIKRCRGIIQQVGFGCEFLAI